MHSWTFAVVIFAGVIMTLEAKAERICGEPECRVQCWQVPGGRRCHRECRRRCWNSVPRYQAPQQYYAQPRQVGPQIDPGLALGVAVLLVVGLVALIANAFNNDRSTQEIAAIERSTASLQAGADEYERQARTIHEDIAAKERRAFAEGEAQAEREWEQNRRRRS